MSRILGILVIGVALLLGCGESRQQKFERALREAESARVDLEAERDALKQSEASYEEARKQAERAKSKVETTRKALDAANEQLEAARAEVLKWAPADMLPPELRATLPAPDPANGAATGSPAPEHPVAD